MPGGYTGNIYNIDLSGGVIKQEALDEGLLRDFIGGYGLGARLLFSRQKAEVDPLGPDNTLGIISGPITGTPLPFASRFTVVAKSPLTGTWGDSNCGGSFGPYLKFAGCDALFFTGRAETPVYLLVDDGRAELRDARPLWGKDTLETEEIILAELGREARVLSIGPSGEKQSLISSIVHGRESAAGRSGLGAVMGAKGLKAVVVRGTGVVPLAHPDRILPLKRKFLSRLRNPYAHIFRKYGTPGLMRSLSRQGIAPARNYASTAAVEFQDAHLIFGGPTVLEYQESKHPCWRCPLGCKGHLGAGEGEYKWEAGTGRPEFETIASFGPMCLNSNLESIFRANDICNRYGLDTVSAGATIAFAIECFERGLIGPSDTDGIDLTWGNHRAIVSVLEKMARREGFGEVLADGARAGARRIGKGAEEFAMHIQGQEIPNDDPRALPSWVIAYKLDATPGRHMQGGAHQAETGAPPTGIGVEPLEPHCYSDKGEAHRRVSALYHILNVSGFCLFGNMSLAIDATALVESLSAVCGWGFNSDELLEMGDRIANIRHAFNLREGLNPLEFQVPARVLGRPPLAEGPTAGVEINISALEADYLRAMSWDPVTARPSHQRLVELGLHDVARALEAGDTRQ